MRSFNDDDKSSLRKNLIALSFRLGFKKTTIEDIEFISNFIIDNYLPLCEVDVFDAFEMGISGKLGIDNLDHYQSFNVLYVAKFLNPYSKFRETKIHEHALRPPVYKQGM